LNAGSLNKAFRLRPNQDARPWPCIDNEIVVGKVRAGHLVWPSRPLHFFLIPPCHPPEGDFPPATPSGGSRGRARAFLCSSPVTAPAFSLPHSGKGVAGPFRCPRSGIALAFPRAVFSFPAAGHAPTRSFGAAPPFQGSAGKAASVAVAGVAPRRRSLPAWCTVCRAVIPLPPSRVPSSVGAGLRSAPPAFCTFLLPGPGRLR